MEDNCPGKPKNFKEFIRSPRFLKPLQIIIIGSLLGFILYHLPVNSHLKENIFGDMLAGMVIALFFTRFPCLNRNSEQEL